MEDKQVPYWDYIRMTLALGYVCTELEARCGMEKYRAILSMARRLAGERGCRELENVGVCFTGFYNLFRPPLAPGGMFNEPEERTSPDLRGGGSGRYG